MRENLDAERGAARCNGALARRVVVWALALTVAFVSGIVLGLAGAADELAFGAQMAADGNWREARFRWENARRTDPENPRVLNNLAVAAEALGEPDAALELYADASTASGGDERIEYNLQRFRRFWRHTVEEMPELADDGDGKLKGKVERVEVRLPVPPRLDTSAAKTLLVTSFLADENVLIDTGSELVRFLRSEFRRRTELDVLGITPPPAIPEQSVEDLLANAGFWKHLGREYEADLIVSGAVAYDRRDASGFQDVDRVSPVTGQRVRRTEFVEQEEFTFELDLFFIDGATGQLLLRDRLRRSAIFRGQQNDPITAFFELGEGIADDVLAVVAPRPRSDVRIVFRR
jgi:hypothetical protein